MLNLIKGYYVSLSRRTARLIDRAKMTEHTFMIFVAIFIGVFSGFGAIAIRFMINAFSGISFPGNASLLENIIAAPWYVKMIAPIIGGIIVGPIIFFFAKEAKGHGVPEVMQAIILKGGIIRPRVAFVKAIASAITIGTGGSVGREGPIIQIGSSLGSTVGQFLRISSSRLKTFVGCGAAAGIAAAFNAPIAGALFAVEIILGDFGFTQFSPIVISSVVATVVSHHFEGNFAAFTVPKYQLQSPYELFFYLILGIFCGLVAYSFIRVLYFSEDLFDNRIPIPEYLKPALGGVLIGIIALQYPQVMGVGYDSINNALHGHMVLYIAFILILGKIIATSITLGSGGSGGIFAPSLFLGAMSGCFFGWIIKILFPEIPVSPGAYALVAMGGVVAGTTHAPITAIIIVFEMTNDYKIILPLMFTCIISTIVSTKLSRESIYTLKLLQRNIQIKDGTEINILKSIYVKNVFSPHYDAIEETQNFNEIVNRVISGTHPYFPVITRRGNLTGMISIYDVKDHLFDREILQDLLIARDIAVPIYDTVTPNNNCQSVLEIMTRYDLDGLPVIDTVKHNKLIGMIWRKDILEAYNKEIEKRDITTSFASRITLKNIDKDIHFMEGYALTEIPAPQLFVGKTIKEMNIRARYGVDVLLIRSNTPQGSKIKAIPNPDYKIEYNDSLIIAGEIGKINLVKGLL